MGNRCCASACLQAAWTAPAKVPKDDAATDGSPSVRSDCASSPRGSLRSVEEPPPQGCLAALFGSRPAPSRRRRRRRTGGSAGSAVSGDSTAAALGILPEEFCTQSTGGVLKLAACETWVVVEEIDEDFPPVKTPPPTPKSLPSSRRRPSGADTIGRLAGVQERLQEISELQATCEAVVGGHSNGSPRAADRPHQKLLARSPSEGDSLFSPPRSPPPSPLTVNRSFQETDATPEDRHSYLERTPRTPDLGSAVARRVHVVSGADECPAAAEAIEDRQLLPHRPQAGDIVVLGANCPKEYRHAHAIVTKVAEKHCTVAVLDDSRRFGVGECWPCFQDVTFHSCAWRLGARVVVNGLRGARTQVLNGQAGTIVEHAREGHPTFIRKPSDPERPQLTLCIALDDSSHGGKTVLLEPRFLVEYEQYMAQMSSNIGALAATLQRLAPDQAQA